MFYVAAIITRMLVLATKEIDPSVFLSISVSSNKSLRIISKRDMLANISPTSLHLILRIISCNKYEKASSNARVYKGVIRFIYRLYRI